MAATLPSWRSTVHMCPSSTEPSSSFGMQTFESRLHRTDIFRTLVSSHPVNYYFGMTLALAETHVLSRFTSDYGEALEEVACSLCGGTESNLLYEAGDVLYGRPGSYRVVRCSSCSLAYVNPRPTFTSLAQHY